MSTIQTFVKTPASPAEIVAALKKGAASGEDMSFRYGAIHISNQDWNTILNAAAKQLSTKE